MLVELYFKKLMSEYRMIFYNIRWRLIASFLLISIVPLAVVGIISYLNSYKAIEERVGVYSQQILNQTTGKLDYMLKNLEDTSLQMVSSTEIQALLKDFGGADAEQGAVIQEKLEQKLGNIISTRNDIVGVNILLTNSSKLFISGETLIDPGRYDQNTVLNSIESSSSKLLWTSTRRNDNKAATYTYITELSRAIKAPDTGRNIGVIDIGIKEFAIADTFSYIDLGPTGFVFVIDSKGNVVSHLQKNKLTKPAEYGFIKRILTQPEDRERTFPAVLDGQRVLVSYAISEVTGWYMVSVIPYDYLMNRIEEVGYLTFFTGLLLFLVAILISALISISISRPVEKLVGAMKRVENGDLSVKVDFRNQNEIERLGVSFNAMIDKINALIAQVYEAEISKKEAEITALQSQINPHFLYNTLALIDGIASMHGEKEICRISQSLGDIFRYSISGTKYATIEEELKMVGLFLAIHEIRHKGRFSSRVTVDEELKGNMIAKLLIEPIVENAIIHGIEKKRGEVYVNVEVKPEKDYVLIIVEDNGMGMEPEELQALQEKIHSAESIFTHSGRKERYHIGLGNVNRRIKLYYGEEYGISICSKPGKGTAVTVKIPRLEEGDEIHA